MKLEQSFCEKHNIVNKIYCYRYYENGDVLEERIRMHCFLLFYMNDKWYHFEHSNQVKRGIHEFDTVELAIEDFLSDFSPLNNHVLTEIPEIPDSLSFSEFNTYINNYDFKNNIK